MVQANWLIHESKVSNAQGCKIPVRSHWDLGKLEKYLENYSDKEILKYWKYGWPVGCIDPGFQSIPDNHRGAKEHAGEVRDYLKKQSASATLIGPLQHNPFGDRARFSSLNTRDKKDSTEKRVILDLSAPRGYSVNDGTPKDFYLDQEQDLHFPTVDSLVQIIREMGAGCLLYKVDRKSAYKFENIDPGDVHLMGMIFDQEYYFDTTLSMGARHAAGCCHRSTAALIHIHESQGYRATCFIDDMAGGNKPGRAFEAFRALQNLLEDVGIKEAKDKACAPSTLMIFLGILFNTVLMIMEITPERLTEIKAELVRWASKEFATLRQVQSLVGKLNFCASTVRAGRLFFSRVLLFLKTMAPKGFARIPAEVKQDLKWWVNFMQSFDGRTCIPEVVWARPDLVFSTDASPLFCGGWSPAETSSRQYCEFFAVAFPDWILSNPLVSINELEALALLVGVRLWGPTCVGKRLLVHCDNLVTVEIVNSGRAANIFAQACMRELHFWCAKHDFQVKAVHLSSSENRMADLASRMLGDSVKRREFEITTKYMKVKRVPVEQGLFIFTNNW